MRFHDFAAKSLPSIQSTRSRWFDNTRVRILQASRGRLYEYKLDISTTKSGPTRRREMIIAAGWNCEQRLTLTNINNMSVYANGTLLALPGTD